MALLDLIASGGRGGTSLPERVMGMEKLQMQQESLSLQKATTMSNLQTIKEKRAKDQQKASIYAEAQAASLQHGKNPEEQRAIFDQSVEFQSKNVGRVDVIDELRESYGAVGKPQSKHARLSELARQTDRSEADEREFVALRGYQPSPDVKIGKRDIGHAQRFLKGLDYFNELSNPKLFAEDLADRAEQIRVDARVKGGKGINRGDALKQAEQELREAGNIKDRDLAIPFGQANYVYDPYGEGEGVTTLSPSKEDDGVDINDMEDEDTDDGGESPKTYKDLKEGESGVFDGYEYRRVGGRFQKRKV